MWLTCVVAWIASVGLHGAAIPLTVGENVVKGTFATSADSDTYTFTATAGQLVFFRALTADAAFEGNLAFQLRAPGGDLLLDPYFLTREDRTVLKDPGTYSLKVYVFDPHVTMVGNYSFQLLAVQPDDHFTIHVDDTVNESVPGGGSGRIRSIGHEQFYAFDAFAGQNVIFEDLSADASLNGLMSWTLVDPDGEDVFDDYITGGLKPGRLTLTKAGTYRIRAYVFGSNDPKEIGRYSFRLTGTAQDVTYHVTLGSTVSDGQPGVGAGRITLPSEQDFYTFDAEAGQNVVFEDLSADAAFHGKMSWSLFAPNNNLIFDNDLTGKLQPGRITLETAGTYKIRAYVFNSKDPTEIGAYSFRLTALPPDQTFPIQLGQVVSDGFPSDGAGRISAKGEEDFYTFFGKAGQGVTFEDLSADAAFKGIMAWMLRSPTGHPVFSGFLTGTKGPGAVTLPETGVYSIRAYLYGTTDATQVGTYSFRTYIPVYPQDDNIATLPGVPVEIQFSKFLFNDVYADGDSPIIDLPQATSTRGGTVTATATGIRYTPPAGFNGVDQFSYRLVGNAGGVATAVVSVSVAADANQFATVVGLVRGTTGLARLCLQGVPGALYQIEASKDLNTWTPGETLSADADGGAATTLNAINGNPQYYLRFRKK